MPSLVFTSGRKFSTTTSARAARRRSTRAPCFDLRSRVRLRLLRCRFWKSGPSRGPPGGSLASRCSGGSILTTFAPQSASWRTQVGPARTRVRSSTVKRASAVEARGAGIPALLYDAEKLHGEDQRRAGRDLGRAALVAVRRLRRADEPRLPADLDALHAFLPAADHLIEREFDGVVLVEDLAVDEAPLVLHPHPIGRRGLRAVAGPLHHHHDAARQRARSPLLRHALGQLAPAILLRGDLRVRSPPEYGVDLGAPLVEIVVPQHQLAVGGGVGETALDDLQFLGGKVVAAELLSLDGASRVEGLFLVRRGRSALPGSIALALFPLLAFALLARFGEGVRAHRHRDEDEGRDPHGPHQGALSFDPPSGGSGWGRGSGFTGWTRFPSCRFAGGMSRRGGEVSDCDPVTSGPFCSGGGEPPSDSHPAVAVRRIERAASLRMARQIAGRAADCQGDPNNGF